MRVCLELGREGRGSGKAVVFTEFITTQEYLRRLLLDIGLSDEDVTLFRGTNDSERARQAYARWIDQEGRNLPPGTRPTREVAVRLALVHEFRTRSTIFVCTEAGAKGLNLQFCETVINYDLPWNPQRIEQRIGRCHRYSQQRDATVVDFLARENEAYLADIRNPKSEAGSLARSSTASDHVLDEPRTNAPKSWYPWSRLNSRMTFGALQSLAQTLEEVTREIAALRDKIAVRKGTPTNESTSALRRSSSLASMRRYARSSDDCARKVPKGLFSWTTTFPTLSTATCAHATSTTRARKLAGALLRRRGDAALPVEIGRRVALLQAMLAVSGMRRL